MIIVCADNEHIGLDDRSVIAWSPYRRTDPVILCHSLLTMLVIQVFVPLQLHGTFYQDCTISLGSAPSPSLAPRPGIHFRMISFD